MNDQITTRDLLIIFVILLIFIVISERCYSKITAHFGFLLKKNENLSFETLKLMNFTKMFVYKRDLDYY